MHPPFRIAEGLPTGRQAIPSPPPSPAVALAQAGIFPAKLVNFLAGFSGRSPLFLHPFRNAEGLPAAYHFLSNPLVPVISCTYYLSTGLFLPHCLI